MICKYYAILGRSICQIDSISIVLVEGFMTFGVLTKNCTKLKPITIRILKKDWSKVNNKKWNLTI